jgi:lysophospholipase L1-like esterase
VTSPKRRFRVLALGDSCTFGLGVEDDATWPAQLERALRTQGIDAEVVNAGVPGYSAFQGMRFLETRGLSLEPDVVVVTFGFNDADEGMPQSDYETAALLARRGGAGAWLARSRLADAIRRVAVRKPAPRHRPRLDEREFVATLDGIKRLCDARGIGMLVVIWPYEGQIRARSREYAKHQVFAARFCGERRVDGVDLISAFLREGGPLYIDHIHASEHGCGVAARAILPWIAARVSTRPE